MTSIQANTKSPWRTNFSAVPAPERRAARYVLNMLAGVPALREQLADEDFIEALWPVTKVLFDPQVLQLLRAQWEAAYSGDDAEDDDDDFRGSLFSTRNRSKNGFLPGIAGVRMKIKLARLFAAIPKPVLFRLNKADGNTPTHCSIEVLAQCAGLDAVESGLLDFVDKKESVKGFSEFLGQTQLETHREHQACLAAALRVPIKDVQRSLHGNGTLNRLQLLTRRDRNCDLEDYLRPSDLLANLLALEPETPEELLAAVTEPCPAPECTLADFPHLEAESQRVLEVLGKASSTRARGVNALFYGDPGTGKTELARTISRAVGLTAYQVKTVDAEGDGLSREGRLGAYLLTQRMLRGRTDCVILFDEAEDVFASSESSLLALFGRKPLAGKNKGWMNQMLEDNEVPAIWITNDAASMDPAFRRRFLIPVAFINPPRRVRRQIVDRHLGGDGLVSAQMMDELAADNALVPAQFSAARRLLSLRPGVPAEQAVREGISASRRLMTGNASPARRRSATAFDPAFLNVAGGIAPEQLADALARNRRGSMCFFGPPGSGKTELAHVLADVLDRELVVRASSDLVSPYVGETEQNIARMFNELDADHSILLLDEVDSLLRDRRKAQRSWEVTRVNELLQRMEQFPGIFIAATNLMDSIDAAALRRFDFKLQFNPLTASQRITLFAREALGDATAAQTLAPALLRTLQSLEELTPGDFANVVRQRELLGEEISAEEFLRRLVRECRYKSGLRVAA